MIPTAAIVALLVNPTSSYSEPEIREAQEASRTLGLRLHVLEASSERDIDAAFASLLELRASALLVSADPFFSSRRNQLVALAARYASPAIYAYRDFAEGGGLMSYGANTVFPHPAFTKTLSSEWRWKGSARLPMRIAKRAPMSAEFSRARNPPT